MDPESAAPVRFPLHMEPSFREDVDREAVLGTPIRWRHEDDVLMQGIVVDWEDQPDGSIVLSVEASAPES